MVKKETVSRKIRAIEALVAAQASMAQAQTHLAEAMQAVMDAVPDSIPPAPPIPSVSGDFKVPTLSRSLADPELEFDPDAEPDTPPTTLQQEPFIPPRPSSKPTRHQMPAMTGEVFERSVRALIKDKMTEQELERVRNTVRAGIEQRLITQEAGDQLLSEIGE